MKGGLLLSFSLLTWFAAPAGALEVGASRCDITPDVQTYRVPLAGYGARAGKPATGVHDPLFAKVLFFRNATTNMALITCDLRSITPDLKKQVINKIEGLGLNEDNVLICASHTHDGPSLYPEKFWRIQFGDYDPKIVEIMSDRVAKAVKNAATGAVPAKVGFEKGMAQGFSNNRRWGYDSQAREDAGETPAVEPVVTVMRVDNLHGETFALLVHFATHPTLLGAGNLMVSAEWPGVLQRELEKDFPGSVVFYANGAEGDQSPAGAQGSTDFEKMEDFGIRLAGIAAEVVRNVQTEASLSIAFARVTPELPAFAFTAYAQTRYGQYLQSALEDLPKQAEIQLLRIGETVFCGLPGEPILEVGRAVRKKVMDCGFKRGIVVGLANDYIGYIVNEKEYSHGGYEVDSRSYYGPGLGDFIAEHAKRAAESLK
jgi:hypothetical protein